MQTAIRDFADVKCSHGCPLVNDETAMFYMHAGIPKRSQSITNVRLLECRYQASK
jgi:hypothetical protein